MTAGKQMQTADVGSVTQVMPARRHASLHSQMTSFALLGADTMADEASTRHGHMQHEMQVAYI
jgi:hypothetical protein